MAYDQCFNFPQRLIILKGTSWRDHMVVGFITTYAISAYHHKSCEFESRSWRGVLDTTLCGKVCQWLATGRWISPVLGFSSTHKTDRHDITEILLKVALNNFTLTLLFKSYGTLCIYMYGTTVCFTRTWHWNWLQNTGIHFLVSIRNARYKYVATTAGQYLI
jgi:hypothetical protein